jgi:glutamate-ammonia-ligase adenylyltransferase
MLAVSLTAFAAYQRSDAWTWEHLALCRARALTGSADFRQRVTRLIHDLLAEPRDAAKVRSDAATMRVEMARHKPAASPIDVKLGLGGLVDLEFTVHTLQLTTGIGLDPRLEVALAELSTAGLIDEEADADLRLLSRFLVVMRLVAPEKIALTDASRALVASLCGQSDWDALIAALDEARRRVAARWDKVREGR